MKTLKLACSRSLVSVSIQTNMGMDRGQLGDQRWEFVNFSLFFAILGQIRPFEHEYPKMVNHHAFVSVLGICSHSNQLGVNRDHLSHLLLFVYCFLASWPAPGGHIRLFGVPTAENEYNLHVKTDISNQNAQGFPTGLGDRGEGGACTPLTTQHISKKKFLHIWT